MGAIEGMKVVIADDHPPTRAGVSATLTSSGFDVVAEESDASGAVRKCIQFEPDIALLDIHMPGNGISAANEISQRLPETRVVMLTVSDDENDLFDALRAGAVGYLLKDTDPDRLPEALRGVIEGEAALPRVLMARVLNEFRARGKRRLVLPKNRGARLTSREWEVLEMMVDGASTKEMAERLFVSAVTIRTHVASILKKLKVPDRKSAVRLVRGDKTA
jgi:DNA-binding NarL/FixJ family response regulator